MEYVVKEGLKKLEVGEKYDMKVKLWGGGLSGECEGLGLGMGGGVVKMNGEDKKGVGCEGLMSGDCGCVEGKKGGGGKGGGRLELSKG